MAGGEDAYNACNMLRVLDLGRGDPPPTPARVALDPAVVEGARAILARVRDGGDAALAALSLEHDGVDVEGRLGVSQDEIDAAVERLDPDLLRPLRAMHERLRDLHERQVPRGWEAERDGIRYAEVVRSLRAAGCYVPGGRAAYPSSVLMTVVPARVAGVERVVVCSPPRREGELPDAVLAAARVAGAHEVYRLGGAHAVAAMAYGTETISPVDTIVGPGNVWVTAAKREVAGDVGVDGLAGPTELALVADDSADPSHLAVDLVAQCEHDPMARSWLICIDASLPERILPVLRAEVEGSPRREIVEQALLHAVAVVVPDLATAAEVVDGLAPEHVQVIVEDPEAFLARIRSFGAAFLGPHTPVSLGDYGVGSNHVLPTMATARFSSGLRASDFVTVSSVVEAVDPAAAERLGAEVEAVAAAEGLHAHARASEVRRT